MSLARGVEQRGQSAFARQARRLFEELLLAALPTGCGGRAGGRLLGLGQLARRVELAAGLHGGLELVRRRLAVLAGRAFEHLGEALVRGAVERDVLLEVDGLAGHVGVGAARQQHLDGVHAVERGGEDERRLAPLGFGRVDVGLGVEQRRHDRRIAGRGRQMQRRRAAHRSLGVDLGAHFEQRPHRGGAAGAAGQVQRRVLPDAGHGAGIGAGVDQHLGHLGIALVGGPVQGAHAVALRGVDVGALLDERAHGLAAALHGGVGDGAAALRGARGLCLAVARSRRRREHRAHRGGQGGGGDKRKCQSKSHLVTPEG